MADTAPITLNLFDGTRQPLNQNVRLLVTLRDGNQKQVRHDGLRGPTVNLAVEFFNNLGDNYTVIAFAKGYRQAGFYPVKVLDTAPQIVDIMLLPKKNRFNFTDASWIKLKKSHPRFTDILGHSAANASEAAARYEEFLDTSAGSLAAFLNIATAIRDIILPTGKALDYLREVIWDQQAMKRDRFFAYAEASLVDQVKQAADHGEFEPQIGLDITHPGATRSFKQKQLGEANVQLTFHENDKRKIEGVDCLKVELDMDYFKDFLAHSILEVIPNTVSGGTTDPRDVYVLRWIAGRHARIPEFDPPYTIEPRV